MIITDDARTQALVGPQFQALADALDDQDPAFADQPSLCAGWSIKHVVAHMTMAARYDPAAFAEQLAAAGYDFDTLSETVARRDGDLPFSRLLDDLRSDAMARWAPPGGGPIGALTHVVIHGLDITSAAGLPRTADDEATRLVLDFVTDGPHNPFGDVPPGLLRATDLDWQFGVGTPTDATAADILLTLSHRHSGGPATTNQAARDSKII